MVTDRDVDRCLRAAEPDGKSPLTMAAIHRRERRNRAWLKTVVDAGEVILDEYAALGSGGVMALAHYARATDRELDALECYLRGATLQESADILMRPVGGVTDAMDSICARIAYVHATSPHYGLRELLAKLETLKTAWPVWLIRQSLGG